MKIETLHVEVEGKGQPLILLHGIVSTHRYWHNVVDLLDKRSVQVIRPDMLGFGNSPYIKKGEYTIDLQIACLEKTILEVAEPPYVLVGHSMGAVIALEWAVRRPDLFSKLVLTSLPMLKQEQYHVQFLSLAGQYRLLQHSTIAKILLKGAGFLHGLPYRLIRVMTFQHPEHISQDIRRHSPGVIKRALKNLVMEQEVIAKAQLLNIPTTVLASSDDLLVGDSLEKLKKACVGNSLIHITDTKTQHNIPLVVPEMVVKAIMDGNEG